MPFVYISCFMFLCVSTNCMRFHVLNINSSMHPNRKPYLGDVPPCEKINKFLKTKMQIL